MEQSQISGGGRRWMLQAMRLIGAAAMAVMLCAGVLVPTVRADDSASAASAPAGARERSLFNADWRFTRGDAPDANGQLAYEKMRDWIIATGNAFVAPGAPTPQRPAGNPGEGISFLQNSFDDSAWRQLTLPHDWAIEGPFDINLPGDTGKLPWVGVGWYRKHFTLPATDAGRRIFLDVDGAMSYSEVWLNGKFVGGWPYGYASWELDLTPYATVGGDNVLAIRLDNPPRSSRWYPGAGIYRNVWLVKTAPVHVAHWGTYITTPQVTADAATVKMNIAIAAEDRPAVNLTATVDIFALDADGKRTGEPVASSHGDTLSMKNTPEVGFELSFNIDHPRLWSIATPNRYCAVLQLQQDGKTIDHCETPFGIRTIRFDVNNGFLLNGQRVQIQGVCDHADLGALGSVANTAGLRRQISILKSMGCNAIRTSHNPPAPQLLDLCDEMGMVVMDEGFDCWLHGKNPNDYHLLWNDWHEKDWRAQIRRDRNHPCVVLWSTGNEVPDLRTRQGPDISKQLTAIAHEEDPTRPTIFACPEGFDGVNKGVIGTGDVWGENYRVTEYEKFRQYAPNLPMLGSETASAISSRGAYFFPTTTDRQANYVNYQVNSYGQSTVPWGQTPEQEWAYLDRLTYLAGEFVWTGFDYLGEPTPYGRGYKGDPNFSDPAIKAWAESLGKDAKGHWKLTSRSSYFGIIDLCGFPKDRYYLYQSRWRSDFPMAHILPHWNWPDRVGQVTPVVVYTSGNEAELFLNGQSLGRKKKENYAMRWDDVKYQTGELKVVAYHDGKEWATDTVKTAGPPAKLLLKPDRNAIAADGDDLSFVTVSVADSAGLTVPQANNPIQFSIEGPGELVATDNGDATDLTAFPSPQRKAFNGLALAIVRAKRGTGGTVTLRATANGLDAASVEIATSAR